MGNRYCDDTTEFITVIPAGTKKEEKRKVKKSLNLNLPFNITFHKGGEGSGNFGHEGRPGEVGGSGEGGIAAGSKGDLKLLRCQSPSANALQSMREGKYFASQIRLVDWSGSSLDQRKPENKILYNKLKEDLKVAAVRSNHPESRDGLEWHHIDRSSSGYMVHISMLRDMGWKIGGIPNKEFTLLQKAFLNENCECESSPIQQIIEED